MKALVIGDPTALDQALGMSVVNTAPDESIIDAYHFASARTLRQLFEGLGLRGGLAPANLKRSLRTADHEIVVWILDPLSEAVFELGSGLYLGARRISSPTAGKLAEHPEVSKHPFGSAEHFRLWTSALSRLSRDAAVPNDRPWLIVDLFDAYETRTYEAPLERYISAINSTLRCGTVRVGREAPQNDAGPIFSGDGPALTSLPDLSRRPAADTVRATRVEALGYVEARNVRTGHFVEIDGALRFRGMSNGKPSLFVELDVGQGGVVRSFDDKVHATCAALLSHSNGKVYGSVRQPNDASLWELPPSSDAPKSIGAGIGGEQMVRTMAEAPDGSIYMTTFPNAKLVRFDPSTEEFEDFGRVSAAATYAWGLAIADQQIWVGTGPAPGLYEIDLSTKSVREFALPESWRGRYGFVSEIVVSDDGRLVAGMSSDPSDACTWYELETPSGTWRPFEAGKYIDRDLLIRGESAFGIAQNQTAVVECDTQTAQVLNEWHIRREGQSGLRSLTSFGLTSGGGVVAMCSDGTLYEFKGPNVGLSERSPGFPVSRAVNQSLAADGRGNVLVGTYLSSGVVGIAASGRHVESIAGPIQVDSWAFDGDDVLMASYPGVQLYRGRLTSEGKWSESPSRLTTVGREKWGLDRPAALLVSRGRYYVGAIASYGDTQGALVHGSLADAARFTISYPVHDQSVSTLADSGGYIIGGTTVHGGLGSRPRASRAVIFIYDPAAGRTIGAYRLPWPSATVVDLAVEDDDSVLGLTDEGILFRFHYTRHQFTWASVLPYRHRAPWGYHGKLVRVPEDGSFYVLVAGEVLHVPSAGDGFVRLLGRGIRGLAPVADSLYFIKREVLMRAQIGTDHGTS